jgi:hypothetical protein
MLNDTSGGFEPSEVTEVAVKPIGSPSLSCEVMIATPEAWVRKAAFRASEPITGKFKDSVVISR